MLKMITEKADHLSIDSRANGKIGVRPETLMAIVEAALRPSKKVGSGV